MMVVMLMLLASQPGMGENGREVDAILRPHPEAGLHQIAALRAHRTTKVELSAADLVVLLEGDVAADHVEEKDAEGPDGEGGGAVAVAADPLGRCVHSRPCNRERKRSIKNVNILCINNLLYFK